MNVTTNVPVLVVSALNGFTRTRTMSPRLRAGMLRNSRSRSVRHARSHYTDREALRRVQVNSSWDSAYTQTEPQILPRQQNSGPNSLGGTPNWSALVSGTALWMLSPSMVQGVAGAKVCATDEESGNVTCHERLSPGAIAAIVVSSVLVFLLLISVAFFIHRTRQRRQEAVKSAKWVFGHHHQNKYDIFERPELGYGGWSFNPGNKSSGGNHRPSHDVASSKIWSAPGTARSINEKHTGSVMGSGTAVGSGGTRMGSTGIGTGKTNQTQTGSARSGGPWSAALAWRGFRNWSWMTRSAPGDKANFRVDPYTYGQEYKSDYGGRSGASSGHSGGRFEEIDIHSGGVNGNGHGNGNDEKFMNVESSQIEGPKGWEGRYEKFHLSLGLASAPLAGGGKNAWSGGRGGSLRRTRDRESERNVGNGSRNDVQTKSTSANGARHGTSSSLSRIASKSAGVVKQSTSAGASVVSRSSQSTRNAHNDGRSEGRDRSKSRGERDKPVRAPVGSAPLNLREPSGSHPRSQGAQKTQGQSLTIQPSISAHTVPPQLSSAVAIAQAAVRRAEMSQHVYNGSGSPSSSRKPLQLKHLPNVTSTVLSGPGSAALPAIPAPSSPLVASVTATDLDHPPRSQRLPPLPPTPSIPLPISPLPEQDEEKPETEARKEVTREQYEKEMFGYF